MTATNEDLIGRADINDLEAILSVVNTDPGRARPRRRVRAYDTLFTWDYDKGARPRLDRLYEKAKTSQWNAQTDLPWDTDVDQETDRGGQHATPGRRRAWPST